MSSALYLPLHSLAEDGADGGYSLDVLVQNAVTTNVVDEDVTCKDSSCNGRQQTRRPRYTRLPRFEMLFFRFTVKVKVRISVRIQQ